MNTADRAGYVAAVSNPNNPAARSHIPTMEKAAARLKVKFETFNVDRPNEFTAVFDAMAGRRVPAAVVTQDGRQRERPVVDGLYVAAFWFPPGEPDGEPPPDPPVVLEFR